MIRSLLGFTIFLMTAMACQSDEGLNFYVFSYEFRFDNDGEGWIADFADYAVSDSVDAELNTAHGPVPSPDLNINQTGLMLSGASTRDGIFMFIKRKITGLEKGKEYNVSFEVNVAATTNTTDRESRGSALLKVGATQVEPRKVIDEGYYRMNIDKGAAQAEGKDMKVVGEIEGGLPYYYDVPYNEQIRNNDNPITVTSSPTGELWLIIGADVAGEGHTAVYFTSVNVIFSTLE